MSNSRLALLLGTALCAVSAPIQAQTLTLGLQESQGHNLYVGAQALDEKLQELSGGTMSLDIFPGAQLGDFRAMAGQVQAGELDLFIHGHTDLNYMIPELTLIGAAYVLPSFEAYEDLFESEWGDETLALYEAQGLRPLDSWYLGMRQMTSNRPINSIDDMRGLKLRVPNTDFLIAFAEGVGAQASPVAFQEVYLALQTNQVDAQENPLPTIENMKFFEVQDYIALTSHFMAAMQVTVGDATWQNLTEEQQGWLLEAVKHGGEVSDELTYTDEAELLAFFEEQGLEVTEPELTGFREAMQPYYDTLESRFGEGSVSNLIAITQP
ncbi:DctP family TRAP transporter solute-binding subunit [Pelagibacterium luteolum]|uniref:Tripartite ATP-independent transporter solute receptor, DctP family n=1 Tax=Pelagibacterium luteolum TaxID=440168 RepID=A0A1G7Z7H1_9HYPH|nr:DctP family TRAP transporter solute-binding subunit [Pelagibacterium luteolum]SDH04456.1 tripartite ATP-independent transporter solute receptor, DctP family [Pelagibacterium luteolum]